MYAERGLFIDGAWRQRGGAGDNPVLDPSSGDTLGISPAASPDATREDEAASRGLAVPSATAAWARADVLHKVVNAMVLRTEEVTKIIMLEAGKPLAQSRREWQLSIDSSAGTPMRRAALMAAPSRAVCQADKSRGRTSRSASWPPSGLEHSRRADGIGDHSNLERGQVVI